MHQHFQILIVFFLYHSAFGQNEKLIQELPHQRGEKRLATLEQIIINYQTVSPDSCVKYGIEAVQLARQLKNISIEANIYTCIGRSFFATGDYKYALSNFKQALFLYKQNKNYYNAAKIYNLFGVTYNQMGDYKLALFFFTETERNLDTLVLNKSLEKNVKGLYSSIYNNMGILFDNIDSLQKALIYYKKALSFASEIQDSISLCAAYGNIGKSYMNLKQYAPAYKMFSIALNLARELKIKQYESRILNNIAFLLLYQKKTESCIKLLKKSRSISIETDDKENIATVNQFIAKRFIDLKMHDSALFYLHSSIAMSEKGGFSRTSYETYQMLSDIYLKKGNYDFALKFYKNYYEMKDSVSGQEVKAKLADIITKYETEKKENENIILRKNTEIKAIEISKKNGMLIILIIAGILISSFTFVIIYLFKEKNNVYNNLVNQNLKLLAYEKLHEKTIRSISVDDLQVTSDPDSQLYRLDTMLQKFMIEEKPYLWPELTLDELCKTLKTNRTYLSKLINDKYKKGFHDFISEYRIKDSREMLQDVNYKHMSVEGIGNLAGFKSNSNFHRQFKTLVGVTPSQYREMALKSKNAGIHFEIES